MCEYKVWGLSIKECEKIFNQLSKYGKKINDINNGG